MTLVAAAKLEDGRIWMGADRLVGNDKQIMATPKIYEQHHRLKYGIRSDDTFGIGFAGNARLAQIILAVEPPPWEPKTRSLHAWLTDYCDAMSKRATSLGQMVDGQQFGSELAGDTVAILAVDGRLIYIASDLSWVEFDQEHWAIGVAWETWTGAYQALRTEMPEVGVQYAAEAAFAIAGRQHNIGPLADQLYIS
jgi:hypothetical protein